MSGLVEPARKPPSGETDSSSQEPTRGKLCAMGRPSYDDETLAAYFYPMAPSLFADPVCGADLRRLAVADPDILAAVADVDRTQVRDAAEAPPWQRFRRAVANFNGLAGLRPEGGFRQDSDDMLTGLQRAEVELVVVGAGAAMLLNVPILTENLAVVHRRTPDNVARLFSWLSANGAHHRSSSRNQIAHSDAAATGQVTVTAVGPRRNWIWMSGTLSCAGTSVSETGTNCPALSDLGTEELRASWRQRCTTLALMPRAIATLATDAPTASHSASTCNFCSSL